MKKLLGLAVLLLIVAPALAVAGEAEATTAEISITGMTCGACCTKVETAVNKLEGVMEIDADYEKGIATVTFAAEKVDLEKIVKVINEETSFKATMPEKKTG